MATRAHKEEKRIPPPKDAETDGANVKVGAGGQDQGPDVYNPVGMAGKKAGIVKEIQQEACEPPVEKDRKGTAGKA